MRHAEDHYRQEGWTVQRGLIPPATLDALLADIAGVFGRAARAAGIALPDPTDRASLSLLAVRLFDADRTVYAGAAKQTQFLASVQRLCVGPEMSGMLERLGIAVPALSTRPVIHYMADALKFEGGYHKTPAHQDWRSVQGSLDGVVVWLPLFDVGRNDYPLEVATRSHRLGLLPSEDHAFGHRIADGQVGEDAFSPLPLARGDAVFFSSFLVHRTGALGGDQVRVAISFRYNNAAEPSFVARHHPVPYIYRPDMRLVTEGFPTAADMRRFFPPPDTAP
jgi:ectoine hydroxylase-related dioxygenase (phytanoyl-CoA dioxygenase family)